MANYYASARSNYFKVKDEEAFIDWADSISGIAYWKKEDRFAIYDDGGDSYGWPSFSYDEETGEEREIDLANELSAHLAEGEVAVLIEVGAEKLRYLVGNVVAVNWRGEIEWLNLDRIYDFAQQRWGVTPTRAEY